MDIMNDQSSTAYLIEEYMDADNIPIQQLRYESGVPECTIYRILNDEAELSRNIAAALSKLIPDLSPSFLMRYDSLYQLQKKENADLQSENQTDCRNK